MLRRIVKLQKKKRSRRPDPSTVATIRRKNVRIVCLYGGGGQYAGGNRIFFILPLPRLTVSRQIREELSRGTPFFNLPYGTFVQ